MKIQFLYLLFLFSLLAKAQNESNIQKLSLTEAINFALTNNYSILNANKDIQAAQLKRWETIAIGLPQITGDLMYFRNIEYTKQGVSGNAFNPMGNPDEISTIAFGTRNSMDAKASLSQLLFSGSYIVAVQASKTYLKYFENAKLKNESDIREMVISAYGNVLIANESILIVEKNKTILEKTLADTKEIYKNGLIEEENVEQLQITLSSINSNLNNLRRLSVVALNMLKVTIGMPLENQLQLKDALNELAIKSVTTKPIQSFDVNNNINFQMILNFEEQKKLELKLQRSKALPTIGASVNFGYNAFSNQFQFISSSQQWNNYSNIGVGLSVPLFTSFAGSSKNQQAKLELDKAKTQRIEIEQKLKLQFQSAKSEFEFSVEELETSKNNLSLAERIEKKQQIKFSEGLSSSFDFTEAQRQLYSAQQNYLQSMVNIINKKAALDKITNQN